MKVRAQCELFETNRVAMSRKRVQQTHHAFDDLDRRLGVRVRIAHRESNDAKQKTIVSRIVKKANV
jgi:hypothetical protein